MNLMVLRPIAIFFPLFISNQAIAGFVEEECLQLFNDADYAKAVTVCQQAAQQGDAASQTEVDPNGCLIDICSPWEPEN